MIRVKAVATVRTRIGDENVVTNTESRNERNDHRLWMKNESHHTSDERSIRGMISCIVRDNTSKKWQKSVQKQKQYWLFIAVLLSDMDITHCLATVSRQKERREETLFPFEQAEA